MMKKLILTFSMIASLVLPAVIFAQSSGKIAGTVRDKSTGDPLAGANVILDGTVMGGAADGNGYFVILNVPVSTYTIRAKMMGYNDMVIQNVRVSADITTQVNFNLEQTALNMEEVIVVAERPLIEKNVTSSISLVTNEDMENIPIRGVTQIVALQAGVVSQSGLHIRGSRSDEVGYYVNGVNTTDFVSGENNVQIIQEAVEEFQLLAGGYTAEYGNANGGIIRTELRTGTPKFHTMIDFQTDRVVDYKSGTKFLGTHSYGYHNLVGTVSGPLMSNKIKFFLAGENNFRGDTMVRFSEGWKFENLIDNGIISRVPDTLSISYPDGYTPLNHSNRYTLNGTLLFDYSPIRFRLGGSYSWRKSFNDGNPQLNFLNTREDYRKYKNLLLTGKITHVLSPKTFYEVNFSYNNSFNDNYDEIFGNNWRAWWDSTANAAHNIQFQSRWNTFNNIELNGMTFTRDGSPPGVYSKTNRKNITAGFDFLSQVNKHNEIKFGSSLEYYTARRFAINARNAMVVSWDEENNRSEEYELNPWDFGWAAGVTNYGYDVHGAQYDGGGVEAPRHPMVIGSYITDKIEFNDLIINAGIRMDYYDSDQLTLRDEFNPEGDPNTERITENTFKKQKKFVEWSPRLGFSFPATDRTVFYLQYGKFVQMPQMNGVYLGWRPVSFNLFTESSGTVPLGLDPVRTTSYEIGFRQQVSNFASFDLSLFYKNIIGQVQARRHEVAPQSMAPAYISLVNGDFATTKGVELRLRLRRSNRVQVMANYTYNQAEGTGSTERGQWTVAAGWGDIFPTILRPLDFERKHKGSVVLDYRFAKNDGGPILERLGANLIFNFASGTPYTRTWATFTGQQSPYFIGISYVIDHRERQALEPINNSMTPWTYNFDMRLDKTITLGQKFDVNFYLNVQNVLNTKNVLNVYPYTGSASDDGFRAHKEIFQRYLDTFGQEYGELYNAMIEKNGGAMYAQGFPLYDSPRQIWFGIKLIY